MQINRFAPVARPQAMRFGNGKALTGEQARAEIETKLREKGFGPGAVDQVLGMEMGREGYEITVWTPPEHFDAVNAAMAELTGSPAAPDKNTYVYKGYAVGVWPQQRISPFGPPR